MAPMDMEFYPNDSDHLLVPNKTQQKTLIVACCYFVAIVILWHIPYLEYLLFPFKIFTVGLHELCHAIAATLTCGKVIAIDLQKNQGGSTTIAGGIPAITLPAGYLGSSFIGACLIACGFDINASKVATFVLFGLSIPALFWARRDRTSWGTFLPIIGGLLICLLVASAIALRWVILFLGVMSCTYCIWDIYDDTIRRKTGNSDASEMANHFRFGSSRTWGVAWLLCAIIFFAAGIIVGIVAFKNDWIEQLVASNRFIPVLHKLHDESPLHRY